MRDYLKKCDVLGKEETFVNTAFQNMPPDRPRMSLSSFYKTFPITTEVKGVRGFIPCRPLTEGLAVAY